jgi:Protein of Unknown function (DUF2784)
MYRVLADLVILAHFAWILFLVFGFFFALRGSRIAFIHLGGLAFALLLNLKGWYCPLTLLENYLYALCNPDLGYGGSFLARYLVEIMYPAVSESLLRGIEIVLVCLYFSVYLYAGIRARMWDRLKRSSFS